VTPLVASTQDGSNPQGEEKVIGQEKIVVGDVVGLIRSFHRMSEALINRIDRDEVRVPVPPEGQQRAPIGTGNFNNLRRSILSSSWVPQMMQPSRNCWRTSRCASHIMTTPPI
jgi:hypothetical protein